VQSDVQAFSRHLPCAVQGAGCWLLVASCGLCTAVSSDGHGLVIKKQGRRKECTLESRHPETVAVGGSGQGKVTLRKTTSNKHTVDG
jgi:hypothetical protein